MWIWLRGTDAWEALPLRRPMARSVRMQISTAACTQCCRLMFLKSFDWPGIRDTKLILAVMSSML